MNPKHLFYLRNLNKHVAGPLKANAHDRIAMRSMIAVSGVLSRVIANSEGYEKRIEQLAALARQWLPQLSGLLVAEDEAIHVRKLSDLLSEIDTLDVEALEVCLGAIAGRLGRRDDTASRRLLSEIVQREYQAARDLEQRFNALVQDTALQGGENTQLGLDEAQKSRLATLLRAQCGESEQLGIASVKVNPGGMSKRTIFVELRDNRVLPSQIVLRQDMASSPLGTTVIDEFPLLKTLHAAGVKVPQPLALDADGSVAGSPLLVVSRVSGMVIGDGINIFDTEDRSGCALALAREMARYHAIPIDRIPPSIPGMNKSNIDVMRADIEVLKRKWDESSATSIVIDAAFGWLFDHLDQVGEQRSLNHGDLRFHNLLVEGSDVSALIDWELAMVTNPAFDLAYVYQDIKKLVDWRTFLDAYAAAGGTIPPKGTLDFYLIRTELFIAVNLLKMEDGFLAGAFDELLMMYGSISFPQYCRYLLAERLSEALSATSD